MSLFPDIDREEALEDALQIAAAAHLLKLERRSLLTFNHCPLEGDRTDHERDKMYARGAKPGQPDLDVFLAGGRATFFELKTKSGWVSHKQTARHDALRALGFEVHVIKSPSPDDCIGQLDAVLRDQYGIPV